MAELPSPVPVHTSGAPSAQWAAAYREPRLWSGIRPSASAAQWLEPLRSYLRSKRNAEELSPHKERCLSGTPSLYSPYYFPLPVAREMRRLLLWQASWCLVSLWQAAFAGVKRHCADLTAEQG